MIIGARFAIDSHSGAFLDRRWRWSLGVHRLVSREALVTIVHNRSQEAIVRQWGCRYCVISFTPGDYPAGIAFLPERHPSVAVINTFARDEPVRIVFEAARRLADVIFYVTGDPHAAPRRLLRAKPTNCILTGYVAYDRYIGLLRSVDAIMDLTLQDQALLMGGFEAVSLGVPLITSDWPILRDYFSMGTVHVANTSDSVCEGVRMALRDKAVLQQEIVLLRRDLQTEWEQKLVELKQFLVEG
jgi:hypothetical protein